MKHNVFDKDDRQKENVLVHSDGSEVSSEEISTIFGDIKRYGSLKDSVLAHGIAYADGTERITQLNRSVNNNLMSQIEYLTSMLYSQLGITQSILDGTADEKTARSQSQSISFFRDPFKLVPVNDIDEIADKFTRNEIMTSNEIRQVIGMKPSDDPRADELRNKNLSAPSESEPEINPPVEDENVETE